MIAELAGAAPAGCRTPEGGGGVPRGSGPGPRAAGRHREAQGRRTGTRHEGIGSRAALAPAMRNARRAAQAGPGRRGLASRRRRKRGGRLEKPGAAAGKPGPRAGEGRLRAPRAPRSCRGPGAHGGRRDGRRHDQGTPPAPRTKALARVGCRGATRGEPGGLPGSRFGASERRPSSPRDRGGADARIAGSVGSPGLALVGLRRRVTGTGGAGSQCSRRRGARAAGADRQAQPGERGRASGNPLDRRFAPRSAGGQAAGTCGTPRGSAFAPDSKTAVR